MEMKEEIKKEHFECEPPREHLKARSEYSIESTGQRANETTSTDCISYEYLSSYNLDDYQYECELSEFLPEYRISFDDLTFQSLNYKSPALSSSSSSSSSSSTTSSLSLSLDFNFSKPQFFNSSNTNACREMALVQNGNLTHCMHQPLPHCVDQPKHFLMINSNQTHNNNNNHHTCPTHYFNSNYKQDVSVGTEFSTNHKCKSNIFPFGSPSSRVKLFFGFHRRRTFERDENRALGAHELLVRNAFIDSIERLSQQIHKSQANTAHDDECEFVADGLCGDNWHGHVQTGREAGEKDAHKIQQRANRDVGVCLFAQRLSGRVDRGELVQIDWNQARESQRK